MSHPIRMRDESVTGPPFKKGVEALVMRGVPVARFAAIVLPAVRAHFGEAGGVVETEVLHDSECPCAAGDQGLAACTCREVSVVARALDV